MNGSDWRTFINAAYKSNEKFGLFFELVSYDKIEVTQLLKFKPNQIDSKLCALTMNFPRRRGDNIKAKIRVAKDTMFRLQQYIKKFNIKSNDYLFSRHKYTYYERFNTLTKQLKIYKQGEGYSMQTQLREGRSNAVTEGT